MSQISPITTSSPAPSGSSPSSENIATAFDLFRACPCSWRGRTRERRDAGKGWVGGGGALVRHSASQPPCQILVHRQWRRAPRSSCHGHTRLSRDIPSIRHKLYRRLSEGAKAIGSYASAGGSRRLPRRRTSPDCRSEDDQVYFRASGAHAPVGVASLDRVRVPPRAATDPDEILLHWKTIGIAGGWMGVRMPTSRSDSNTAPHLTPSHKRRSRNPGAFCTSLDPIDKRISINRGRKTDASGRR